jgi:rod shape determining protein RodA
MKKFRLDYYLLSLLFIMFLISLFSLYKADLINMNVDNILIKQILWYVVGCFLIILILYLKNDIFIKNALLIYIICNILLLLLFGTILNNLYAKVLKKYQFPNIFVTFFRKLRIL